MILRTVEQVRRVFLVIAEYTLLAAGVVMLVTPGPGMLVIFCRLRFAGCGICVGARVVAGPYLAAWQRLNDAVIPQGK
jgi:hypothetical protein